MNYREKMHHIMTQYLFDPWDETTQNEIEEEFREQVPGNYKFVWNEHSGTIFVLNDHTYYFHLTFDDPAEEIIWRLRNE